MNRFTSSKPKKCTNYRDADKSLVRPDWKKN